MQTSISHSPRSSAMVYVFALLLVLIALGTAMFAVGSASRTVPVEAAAPDQTFLALADKQPSKGFSPADIPGWLFVHVGIIASLQVLSLLFAAWKSTLTPLRKRDARIIQFLIEIPMYLGLFGTLLGVCLTQFIAGSLVAPLAYMTTMSGIVLHVLGKLLIFLPIPDHSELED